MIFQRATKEHRCPVCGKPDYCKFGDRAVLCFRVESEHPNTSTDEGGCWHYYTDSSFVKLRPMPKQQPKPKALFSAEILRAWTNGVEASELIGRIEHFAERIGVLPHSLMDLGATWSPLHNAWAFPMRDAVGNMIGIRLRNYEGKKWAVSGSRSGLLYNVCHHGDATAYICEGPTDTAAAITLGLFAIGKPSCNACNDMVLDLLRRLKPKRTVIVSDVDSVSVDGIGFKEAKKLQSKIKHSAIWIPQAKDIREFVNNGGTRQMIENDMKELIWK